MGDISLNDVKYDVTSRSFQRKFYHLVVIKFVINKKFKSFTFLNKQQNIKTFRYDCNWLIEIVRNMVRVRYMVNSPYSKTCDLREILNYIQFSQIRLIEGNLAFKSVSYVNMVKMFVPS